MTSIINQKMSRQLRLYDHLISHQIYAQEDLQEVTGSSLRVLQRDLKDLRDCGLCNVKRDRVKSSESYGDYTWRDPAPKKDENHPRRQQHLNRLYRLGTILTEFRNANYEAICEYEARMLEYRDNLEYMSEEEDPDEEELAWVESLKPDIPVLEDLKARYDKLFPNSNKRTRQRDFAALREAGFSLYYDHEYHGFVYEPEDPDDSW